MVKKGIESNLVGKKKKETGQIDTHTHTHTHIYIYIYIYYVQQKAMLHGHGHDMDTNTGIQQFLKNKDTTQHGHGN